MNELFELVLQNSLAGIIFIAVILIFRQLTRNLSKIYVNILWILLLAELLFTPLVTGPFHTIRNIEIPDFNEEAYDNGSAWQKQASYENSDALNTKEKVNPAGNSNVSTSGKSQGTGIDKYSSAENKTTSTNISGFTHASKQHGLTEYLSYIWLSGTIILTVFLLIQYIALRRRVKTAVKVDDNVWETSECDTPFVMPGIPSRIYIPAGLEGHQRENILSHERQHVRHLDPWIKCAATAALTIHWFNPFVWVAFRLIGKDIEMYCDECVLRGKGLNDKKQYSQTILDFAKKASGFSLTMSFSKSNVENRIKHILYSRKPHLIISIILAAIILTCGVFFLTAGNKDTENTYSESELNEAHEEENTTKADTEETIAYEKEAVQENTTDNNTMTASNEPVAEKLDNQADEDESWEEKSIVGTTFEPGTDLKNRILNAPDYSVDWLDIRQVIWRDMGENTGYSVILIGKTKHFLLYGTSDVESMIIKTPDNRYVSAKVPFTSNYMTQPRLNEMDYDGDGEDELAVIILIKHGTGCCIETLLMVDKAADGNWYMYQLLESEYLPRLEAKFDTVYTEDGIKLLFDGKYAGRTQPVDNEFRNSSVNYKFQAGMIIYIHFVENRTELNADLGGYSDVFHAGDFTGHRINADIVYLGEGKWELKNFRYSDFNIDSVIHDALTMYFTGQTEELNKYCMMEGSQLKEVGEKSKNISVIDISYPVDNLDSGEIEAHAAVRLDGSGSLCYATIPVKMSDPSTDTWKILDIILEK